MTYVYIHINANHDILLNIEVLQVNYIQHARLSLNCYASRFLRQYLQSVNTLSRLVESVTDHRHVVGIYLLYFNNNVDSKRHIIIRTAILYMYTYICIGGY